MRQHLSRLMALTALTCGLRTPAQETDENLAAQCGSQWHNVRLVSQQLDAALSAEGAMLTATFELVADSAAQPALFAFPLWTDGGEAKAAKVTCGETELKPIPFWRLEDVKRPSGRNRKQQEEYAAKYKKRSRADRTNTHLNGLLGYQASRNDRDVLWQLHELSFKAGETKTVTVELGIVPQPLADIAEHGPCQAFRIPLRLAHIWASPVGRLNVTVTLAEDVNPEDIFLVRPSHVKQEGNSLLLSLEGTIPVEDLVVVTKRKG